MLKELQLIIDIALHGSSTQSTLGDTALVTETDSKGYRNSQKIVKRILRSC